MLVLFSCKTEKLSVNSNSATNSSNTNEVKTEENTAVAAIDVESVYYIGVVSLEKNMCGVTIKVDNKAIPDFYPVNLDEMFKIQGATIQFNATVSRAKSPEGCNLRPMALSNVTRVKK
jgi:hypothetical protein